MILDTRPSRFSACNIESWEWPGNEASIPLGSKYKLHELAQCSTHAQNRAGLSSWLPSRTIQTMVMEEEGCTESLEVSTLQWLADTGKLEEVRRQCASYMSEVDRVCLNSSQCAMALNVSTFGCNRLGSSSNSCSI